jgi:CheY-like chemotaxis protein
MATPWARSSRGSVWNLRERSHTNMTSGGDNSAGSLRILVVEDHLDTLEVVCFYLRYTGHDVIGARSKQEAAEAVQQASCDVLISDIGLSDGSGWDLIGELGERRPKYAIAMSAYGTRADVERSFQAGFRHHLVKPVSLEKLAAVLAEAAEELGFRKSVSGAKETTD